MKKLINYLRSLKQSNLLHILYIFLLLLIIYSLHTANDESESIKSGIINAINQQTLKNNDNAAQINAQLQNLLNLSTKNDFSKIADSLNKSIPQIQSSLTNLEKLNNQHSKDQTQLQSQIEILNKNLSGLKKTTKNVQKNLQSSPISTFNTNTKQTISKEYSIYNIADYGVILQNSKGDFIIARINMNLPNAGIITAISNQEVIAGDFIIHWKKPKQ